jgi:hypothetical protein
MNKSQSLYVAAYYRANENDLVSLIELKRSLELSRLLKVISIPPTLHGIQNTYPY